MKCVTAQDDQARGTISSAKRVLRVLVVDDHPVVREGLRAMLVREPGIEVVGEASGGQEAMEKTAQLEPDVVLVDIRMPGMNGIEVTQRIKETRPATAIIVLTMYDSEMYVMEALRAGAAGFLVKDTPPEILCQTIKAVASGGTMVRAELLRRAVQLPLRSARQTGEAQADFPVPERFTAREQQVLPLVAQGRTNKEIAGELHLAEVTVKKHVQSIVGKLGASDRIHAAIMAVRLGLVE